MKTLIIYASRYGFTGEAAKEIHKSLDGETDIVNINDASPDVRKYEKVIIGSSIYMGQVNKNIKKWVDNNLTDLLNKRLGLFICCGLPENINTYLEQAFATEFLEKSVVVCLGGELNMPELRWLDKRIAGMMTRLAQKEGKSLPKRDFGQITDFINELNKSERKAG